MNSIFQRTSIRKYQQKDVESEKIDLLMKAAMAAPSAGNQQPWEFYITKDKALIERLSECSPYAHCLKNAPLAIIPCYRTEELKFESYAQIDMSICLENIWLEATSLGLGCVWLGIAPIEERMNEVHEVLSLPKTLKVFALMAIGYPNEEIQPKDRFDHSRIHYI